MTGKLDLARNTHVSPDTIFDLVIIGGGINGCAIAADAALKGLKVCLIEKGSLASATSSASSNLIHGGLRYLELYEFQLVREALKEQVIWQKRAPHLVQPLAFILPHEKHLRPKWLLRLGLWLYDHLTLNKILPKTKTVKRGSSHTFNQLKPHLTEGFCYYDCNTQGAAITIANARLAQQHGAKILTNTHFLEAKLDNQCWEIHCNQSNKKNITLKAKALVNVTGPWVEQINQQIQPNEPKAHVETIKGSHIIVPKLYEGNHAYILQNQDGRIVFALPFTDNTTAIGTTDIAYHDNLDSIHISDTEKIYLCDLINQYFAKSISPNDIISDWSGVRALASAKSTNASAMTRGHQIHLQNFSNTPLVTVLGGKLTNARLVGEEVVKVLKPFLPWKQNRSTKDYPLPGSRLNNEDLQTYIQMLVKKFSYIPEGTIQRWVQQFGSETTSLLSLVKTPNDLGEHFGYGLYAAEVDFLQKYYFAETAEDILFRLTRLKSAFSEEQRTKLEKYLLVNRS